MGNEMTKAGPNLKARAEKRAYKAKLAADRGQEPAPLLRRERRPEKGESGAERGR